ncbi:hypothetical protein ACJA88_001902 [Fusarium oxysporum]
MTSAYGMLLASIAALYTCSTLALTSSFCPNNGDVCFRWGVPKASAVSGSGNIYFQIEAPTSLTWAGLGIGTGMRGAAMFLIYQNGDGNITLSTRTGRGHVMPEYTERSEVKLLAGSGVKNNKMIANIRCGDCSSLNLEGSNSWIAAWKNGNPLNSTSLSARILEHDGDSSFNIDFAQASMSSDSNPFTSSSSGDSSSNSESDSDSDSGSGNGAMPEAEYSSTSDIVLRAHGVIMSIVFLAGYPLGAVLMTMIGKWFIHAGWQVIVFVGMWAGFALGYVYARNDSDWWKQAHTIMGTIVVALIGLQLILGWAHHRYFVNYGKRGLISHAHIWFGRVLMILGIINGGLGLQLAGSPQCYVIPYSAVAGIAAVLYITGIFVGGMRKITRAKQTSPQIVQEEQ